MPYTGEDALFRVGQACKGSVAESQLTEEYLLKLLEELGEWADAVQVVLYDLWDRWERDRQAV